ncbi:hypothetical protein AN219_14730 [Streptomyces nanshensis]|nr:hypothetical protein AN219_14730 [Streptomyces nanshensis]
MSTARWRKSSYSNSGNCLEVADGLTGVVPVRDSKAPDGTAVLFSAHAWSAFIDLVTDGR